MRGIKIKQICNIVLKKLKKSKSPEIQRCSLEFEKKETQAKNGGVYSVSQGLVDKFFYHTVAVV